MKKKNNIQYNNGAGEDMKYYLQHFKKEALKKAEEIFDESESHADDVTSSEDAQHFDMKEIYKTSKPKSEQEKGEVDIYLKEVLEQIKTVSQRTASEIFKDERD